MLELSANGSSILWTGSAAYWTVALILAIVKCWDSRVDGLLRYGLRQNVIDRSVNAAQATSSGLFRYALDSKNGVSSYASWTTFYAIGFTSGLVCNVVRRDNEALAFFTAHTARRLLECVLVHRFSPSRVSLAHVIMGASFYVVAPVTLLCASYRSEPSFLVRPHISSVCVRTSTNK